jgi:hypothetical protein
MVNLFYASYKAVFAAVKAALNYVAAVPAHDEVPEVPASGVATTVFVGEAFTLAPDSPVILVDAQPASVKPLDMEEELEVAVRINLLVLVRETVPASWFDDIISVMGKVADAVLADRTLGGVVKDIYPTGFSPGVITYRNRTFYGGEVQLEGVYYYAP